MCNNFPNIRITEGNNFSIILPLLSRTYVATRPIDEEIDPEQLENVVVTFGGVQYPAQRTTRGVHIDLPATLAVGTYNILLTAEYLGSNIRAAYESAVTIVPWSEQSTAEQYITGSPIVLRAAYVLSGALTDAELEALKEEYREKNAQLEQAIADAEAAKREWEEKAADLDGVAQEETLTQGVADIRDDISHIDIDTTTLAKQGTNPNATLSEVQTQATSAATDAAAAKTAAQGITGYALQGTNPNATNTAILQAIGTGGGTVYPTIQMTETTAAIDPNKVYIWGEVASLDISLNAGEEGVANVYFLEFYSGSTATTLTLPASVTEVRGELRANAVVNIAIFNSIAYIA